MRKLGLVCAVLSIFALGSVPSGAPAKAGTYAPVPLKVTVHATDSTGTLYRIRGDATDSTGTPTDATYTDGDQGVKANIDQYGNVIIDFQTTRVKMRWLVYDYSQPLDGQTTAPPGTGSNHYFSTIGGALQPMQIGDSKQIASCPLYDDDSGQPQYRHSFNRDCQSGFGSVGAPLVVTKTSEATWEVEPDPVSGAEARVFSITTKGRVQVRDFGSFSLPFKMTLTAK